MSNTKEQIEHIYKLNEELQELLEEESNEYKKVIERKDETHTVERNGEEVEVTKGELLEEVRVIQDFEKAEQAVEVLGEDFPRLFEIAEKREEKNNELHDYIQEELGFSFRQMSIADYIKLTEAVMDMKLAEKKE